MMKIQRQPVMPLNLNNVLSKRAGRRPTSQVANACHLHEPVGQDPAECACDATDEVEDGISLAHLVFDVVR